MTGGAGRVGRPIKVLFLHPSDELYGSDLVLLNLVRGLDRARFEPLVALANDLPYEGRLSRELAASGVRCLHLPLAVARRKYFQPAGLLGFQRRLRASTRQVAKLIQREDVALVHSNTLALWTGARAAARVGRPHLWHVHELIERPAILRDYLRRYVPTHASRVIGVAQVGLDDLLLTPAARAKGTVLYNGLEPARWMAATGRARIRAELGAAPDEVVVGMVARISSFKAPDLFVEAAARVVAAHPHVRCFLAGGAVPGQTEMLERVRQLIAASPAPERITLLGFREDVPDLMAGLDVLVQPSRDPEMCSMTILQAMFAGKPVLATDVGGNKELIVRGRTGLLTPREDVPALAAALERLVTDESARQRMGAAGRERALAHFTLDHQTARFNDLLWAEYQTAQQRTGGAR